MSDVRLFFQWLVIMLLLACAPLLLLAWAASGSRCGAP